MGIYLKEIARMSQESAHIDKYKEKLIEFHSDESNLNFKNFEVQQNSIVSYQGGNSHAILNHFEPLPKAGLYYFQAKILKTYGKNLIFGACTG